MKDLLVKPNQLIEIEGTLNLSQMKTYNVILADIHKMVKNAKDKEEITEETIKEKYVLDYQSIKARSGITDKNDNKLRNYIKAIKKIDVSFTDKKSGDWTETSLLGEVQYKAAKDQLHISIPESIRKALYFSNYYTTLDLLMMKTMKSKYSVILYELLKKYEGVKIPEYKIENFSKIFQTNYERFGDVKRYILDKAIPEIEEKTNYRIDYDLSKIGRRIDSIKLKVDKKPLPVIEIEPTEVTPTEPTTNKLEAAIKKAKRNLYASKAWNGRVDNKIKKILQEEGEEFTIKLLNELYSNLKQEVKTTLVQYINGMMKNIKENVVADKMDQEKKIEKVKVKEKEPEEVDYKKIVSERTLETFEKFPEDKQKEILEIAREKYLKNTGTKAFNSMHERIFKAGEKSYIVDVVNELDPPVKYPGESHESGIVGEMIAEFKDALYKSELNAFKKLELMAKLKKCKTMDELIALNEEVQSLLI